ncbi:MAG: hypothetical protein M3Z26_00375 [Bacteroidota bacterium]|nr:hypothetical protein [Bacteroidota bacterium]
MKLLFITITLFFNLQSFSQVQEIKFNCPDSLGFITNQGATKDITFFLQKDEEANFYYVEYFSHENFHDLLYNNRTDLIKRVKLITADYVGKPYDFIYTYNSKNALLFYYILKDWQEEKILQP